MSTSPKSGARDRHALELALGEQVNALLSASRALSERSAAHFHPELQPAAFHIARWLHAFGPARPSHIADEVGMDRSSTSTLIGRMRQLGLLTSDPAPDDRRSIIVTLSEEGHRRVAAALEDRGEVFYRRTQDWSQDELATLVKLLGRLTQHKAGAPE